MMISRIVEKGRTANCICKGPDCLLGTRKFARMALMFITLEWFLMGCVDNRLSKVEQLMDCDVVTADSLINSMDVPTAKRDQALYAMLKTQIDYKMYRIIPNDRLIRIATDYYGTKQKDYHAAMAWYSLGCVYNELHDDALAIESFLKAKDLFPDTILRYYALTEQNIGDVLFRKDMLKEASDMYKRTKAVSELLNDSVLIAYSDFKQSLIHLQNEDFEISNTLLQGFLNNPNLSLFNRLEAYLGMAKIATYHEKDYYKSNSWTDYCISSKSHRAAGFNQRGINYLYLNQIDSAIICFNESMSNQRDIYTEYSNYSCLAESYIRLNQPDSSLHYFTLCDMAVESIGTLLNHEEITSILLSHSEERNRIDITRMKYKLYTSIIITSVILMFVSIIYLIQRDRSRKQYYIDKHDILLESVSIGTGDTLKDIFDLCRVNFERSVGYTILIKGFSVRKISSNDSSVIKHDICTCFKGLYQTLNNKKCVLSKSEFECLICFLLKYDNKDTSLILDKGYSTVTSVKARIKNKIPQELALIINSK